MGLLGSPPPEETCFGGGEPAGEGSGCSVSAVEGPGCCVTVHEGAEGELEGYRFTDKEKKL